MKKLHLLPNLITAFALACGLFVIFKVNMVEPGAGNYEMVHTAALILLLAAGADFIDGAVARAVRAESEFGAIFDSLSDAISFGVAPSVLLLKTLSLEPGTPLSLCASAGAMIYSLCGVFRLVRFNVRAKEVEGNQELTAAQKRHFTGLPIPAAAAAAVSANLFLLSPGVHIWLEMGNFSRAILLTLVMVILGYLMVCRLKFPSSKALHFRVPSFHLAFASVFVAVFVLYGVLYFFPLIFVFVSWSYIVLALSFSVIRLVAGKKSKTLEEFEPDPDEED